MDKEKFLFGDTPTVFITRADHFLHCPTWFDGLEKEPNSNFYETIGLEAEHRSPAIKMFHAMQAMQVGNWKQLATHLLVAHYCATFPNSKIVLIDGYPRTFLEAIMVNVNEAVGQVIPNHRVQLNNAYQVQTTDDYNNVLYAVQAKANKEDKYVFDINGTIMKDFVPELDAYNAALQRYQEAQRAAQAQGTPPAGMFKPYLVKNEDDGGHGGNTLQ